MAGNKKKDKKARASRPASDTPSPERQPSGAPRSGARAFTEMVPVRFAPDVIDEVRRRASADDRSVSSWIRRAVEQELHRIQPTDPAPGPPPGSDRTTGHAASGERE